MALPEEGLDEETFVPGPHEPATAVNTLARAFVLDANSEWITVATGNATSELSEDGRSLTLSLHEEHDANMVLFSTTFHKEQDILRQQATVITWTSGDGSDVALSFENELGCNFFWCEVCKFLGRSTEYSPIEEDTVAEGNVKSGGPADEENEAPKDIAASLPDEVEFTSVPDIDELLERALNGPPTARPSVCRAIMEKGYISKLLDLFRIAEDLQSRETLFRIFNIFKSLILFNNPPIIREILLEKNILLVAGVFEYDPAYPDTRPGFRQYLLDRGRFKQVLQIDKDSLWDLIHQTFRIQYLKDVVLPRILDEDTYSYLMFIIRCNFAEIIEELEGDTEFISKLIPLFAASEEGECESVLKFMKEFLTIAKTSANGRHLKLYQEASFGDFLRFLQRMLAGSNPTCQTLATDVLIGVSQHDCSIICTYMIEAKEQPLETQLLATIIDRVTGVQTEVGLRWQLSALLTKLLDTVSPIGLAMPNDDFLNFFYPDYALRLLSPLVELDKRGGEGYEFGQNEADLYYFCCSRLRSFIAQHKYRIKYLLFRSFIIHNVLLLLKCQKHKFLRLAAVGVIRAMVGTGDDFYFRFLIKQSLLKPILNEAVALGDADNALSAALTELFYFIREESYKLLVNHLVENYRSELEAIQFAPMYGILSACYEELNNPQSNGSSNMTEELPSRPRDTWLGVDRQEEAYFNDDDDDDEDHDNDKDNDDEDETHEDEEEGENEKEKTANDAAAEDKRGERGRRGGDTPRQNIELTPPKLRADEVDIPHQMEAMWPDDLEPNKRMKY